jgi:hypothetical protein
MTGAQIVPRSFNIFPAMLKVFVSCPVFSSTVVVFLKVAVSVSIHLENLMRIFVK